jgi:hypothetical protein
MEICNDTIENNSNNSNGVVQRVIDETNSTIILLREQLLESEKLKSIANNKLTDMIANNAIQNAKGIELATMRNINNTNKEIYEIKKICDMKLSEAQNEVRHLKLMC